MKPEPYTFQLRISLGSAEMNTPEEVAIALAVVIRQLRDGYTDDLTYDVNGNRVGEWDYYNATAYRDDDQRLGGNDNPYPED